MTETMLLPAAGTVPGVINPQPATINFPDGQVPPEPPLPSARNEEPGATNSTPLDLPPRLAAQPGTRHPAPGTFLQVKGETARAFEAFRAYYQLGPKRRYLAAGKTVGASLRTVQRWAKDFDWQERVKMYAAQGVEQHSETENIIHREELLDAAARAKGFRERQHALTETILDAAERYFERIDDWDVDQMSFADACKALELASRLGQRAGPEAGEDPSAPARNLRDQLTALLDQAYGEVSSKNATATQPQQ